MVVAVHQPDYIPWLGFFYKIAKADIFVYLDDAQYSNEAAHNYNYIKTPQGRLRLKIPVEYSFGDRINTVRTRDELGWKKKHVSTLAMNYARAPYFEKIFPQLAGVLEKRYDTLSEMNIAVNGFICEGFGIRTKAVKSSELGVHSGREQRIIDICETLGAGEYYSGQGAKAYQSDEHFSQKGIKLTYSGYRPVEYPQLWGGFIPGLSVVDYIFNCGFDWDNVEEAMSRCIRAE